MNLLLAKKNGPRKLFRYVKNILKIILRKGVPDWTDVIHEVPTSPENVNKYLEKKGIRDYKILVTLNKDEDLFPLAATALRRLEKLTSINKKISSETINSIKQLNLS